MSGERNPRTMSQKTDRKSTGLIRAHSHMFELRETRFNKGQTFNFMKYVLSSIVSQG